jgi:choline transport protein
MAEEVRDAAKTIPRTMMAVYVLNTVLLFPAILTIAYHTPDLDAALNDTTTYPAIYVLKMSMSNVWITVILTMIGFIQCASSINYFAAVTRDLFAFARDNGMPCSSWLGTVHPRKHIPINAGILSCVIGGLLSLIYIGSPVAFYAITSLCTVSLLMCYSMSIGSVLWRRIYAPHTLPPAKFSLGHRFGIICNASAVAFSIWAFFWSFWPQELPVTAAGFNWASPIFVAVFLFSMFYYWWRARHVYVGPVKEVEGR